MPLRYIDTGGLKSPVSIVLEAAHFYKKAAILYFLAANRNFLLA